MEQQVSTDERGITKEIQVSAITVDKVYAASYQKERTLTAQLRQVVTTKQSYPQAVIKNEMQDNIFSVEEYGFATKNYTNDQNRIAFLNVPADSTPELVAERLKSFPNACLYRVLSNEPILTKDQISAVENGLTTLDIIANSQIIRYSKESDNPNAGKLIFDDFGQVQYRQVYFSTTKKEDINLIKDASVNPEHKVYIPVNILEEIGQEREKTM